MPTREIKLGGSKGLSTTVDESDFDSLNLGSYSWCPASSKGKSSTYARTRYNGRDVYLHRLILGLLDKPKHIFVDHKDGNGLNNSRSNLRVTTSRGNQRNRRKESSRKTSSSYKGVYKENKNRKRTKIWRAQIVLPGKKQKCLGYYPTEVEAAQAYNKAATELFGEFACLNVIP